MGSSFLERLKTLQGDLSNAEFARKVGVKPTTFQRYEEGSLPRADAAATIAEACGVSLDWLIAGRGRGPAPDFEIDKEGFRERLKGLRHKKSVVVFARNSGVSEEDMRGYLAGAVPDNNTIVQIAEANGASAEWLATGQGVPFQPEKIIDIEPDVAARLDMKEQYVKAVFYRLQKMQRDSSRLLHDDAAWFSISMINQALIDKYKGEEVDEAELETVIDDYLNRLD